MTENKGDLISREALKKAFEEVYPLATNEMGGIVNKDIYDLIDNAQTVEPTFKPVAEVKFDKEQLQEIVDKAKAEVLASVERPQGDLIKAFEVLKAYCKNRDCNKDCIFYRELRAGNNIEQFCGLCEIVMSDDMRGKEE